MTAKTTSDIRIIASAAYKGEFHIARGHGYADGSLRPAGRGVACLDAGYGTPYTTEEALTIVKMAQQQQPEQYPSPMKLEVCARGLVTGRLDA